MPIRSARLRPSREPAPRTHRDAEDGFIMLEAIVAISLISIVLAALGTFTLRTVQATSDLRARQTATQVATTAMASLQTLPVTDLVSGRDADSVRDQIRKAPDSIAQSIGSTAMTPAVDTSAQPGAGAFAGVPTSPVTQTINNVTYEVNTYLGTCVVPTGAADCTSTTIAGVSYLRAVVAVTWKDRGCSAGPCVFSTSTLVNAAPDPVFNSNVAVAPNPPKVAAIDDQVTSVGATVDQELKVVSGTGAPPHTWLVTGGQLPAGLTLSSEGSITGTPTTAQPATQVTVTVTDAFGRTGSGTVSYRVFAAPTITSPGDQSSQRNRPVSLPATFTCAYGPCTFALSGAPAGLVINKDTGTISGTPTTVGTSPAVTITITDKAGSQATTAPFSWTVTAAPGVNGPGAAAYTVGSTVRIPITYDCPVATCTLTLTDAAPGLSLSTETGGGAQQAGSTAAVDTSATTNLAAGKNATQSSLAYNGSPSRAVDGGTDGVYNNGSITHTDFQDQPWWQVDLGSRSLVRAVKLWNRTDCCADRLSNAYVLTSPSDMTGRSLAALLSDPTVTYQRVESLGGNPTLTLPMQSSARFVRVQLSGNNALSLAEVQVLGTTDPGSSVTVGGPSGTVYVTGTIPPSAVPSGTSKTYSPTVTVTDSTGSSAKATPGPWTVYTAPVVTNPGPQAVEPDQTLSLQLSAVCPNSPCTWTAEAQPQGTSTWTPVTVSSTGQLTYAKVPAGTYQVRVTATDAGKVADTETFTVTVKDFTLTVPAQTTRRPLLGSSTVTVDVAALVSPRPAGYTYALSGAAPTWLSIDAATGVMTATVRSGTPRGTSTITVIATSTASSTSTVSSTFTWTIQ